MGATKYVIKVKSYTWYHLIILCLYVSLESKLDSLYDELSYENIFCNQIYNSNILVLSNRKALQNYQNIIHPKRHFTSDVIEE